jgi:hypothetical protein
MRIYIYDNAQAKYVQKASVYYAYRSNVGTTFRAVFSFQEAPGQPIYYQNFKAKDVGKPFSEWFFPRDNLT